MAASIDSIDPYPEPKPAQFPFHIDIRPDRQWDVVNSFSSTFQKKIGEMSQSSSGIPAKKDLTPEQKYADIKALQQMAGIATGMKFLSRNQKIDIEITDSKDNFEGTREKGHLFKKDLLRMQPSEQVTEDGKTRTLYSQQSGYEGEKNTFYHNANLYQALNNRNPLKKGDKKNYQAFENDSAYAPITSGFLTPLQKLQSPTRDLWGKMNTVLGQITEKNSHYNFQKLEDPYLNNGVDTYDMNLDYHHLVRSPSVTNQLNNEELFYTTLSAFEDSSRYRGALNSIFGDLGQVKGNFLSKPATGNLDQEVADLSATASDTTSESTATDTTPEADSTAATDSTVASAQSVKSTPSTDPLVVPTTEDIAQETQTADSNAHHWWDLVANNLKNSAKLIDASLFPALANSMNQATDWSQLDPQVKDKFVKGYFSHLNNFIMPPYLDTPVLSLGDINLDNLDNAKKVWNTLLVKGYIGEDGTLASRVIENPESVSLDLGTEENARITRILKEVSLGRHNFESVDKTKVNDQERRDQSLYDPYDGTYKTITDVTKLLGSGHTADEQLENTKHAYHVMLDVYANMTGAKTAEGSTGEVKGVENADHTFTVLVSEHGSWTEAPKSGSSSEDWTSVTDQPLSITFASKGEAQAYVDRLAQMTQWSVPVLSMFSPDNLYVLNTNAITTDDQAIHTADTASYREHVSEQIRFTDTRYDKAKEFVRNSSNRSIGQRMFQKNLVNQMLVQNWHKKTDDYDEKKEEYEDEQIDDIVRENEDEKAESADKERRNEEIERENEETKRRNEEVAEENAAQASQNQQKAQSINNESSNNESSEDEE